MVVGLPCAVRGAVHMGAGSWSLLTALFRMIPRFLLMQSARECATPTTPGRRRHWRSRLGAVQSDSYGSQPRESPHRGPSHPKHAPCLRCFDTPQSRRGLWPISARSTTDLEPEVDRTRCGVRPISSRMWTDLDAEYDRSRGGTGPISVRVGERVATASREGFPGEPAPGMRTHRCNDAHSAHWSPSPTLSKSNRIPYAYHR